MDDKFESHIKRARKQYEEALGSGEITKSEDNARFAGFFSKLSQKSLSTAGILHEISNDPKKKSNLGIESSYDGYMWVVIASYYSMFYMASALISKKGIKVGEEKTHKNVKNAFLRLYIENKFLETRLGMDYSECKEMAQDLMRERDKRGMYQYNVGENALKKDAETSLRRARNFFEKTRALTNC